jgi:hypothetical protein
MKDTIHQYISQCYNCQINKIEHTQKPGLLPNGPWQSIGMDFITGLPKSKGKDIILVVVDRFTKYGHFIPLSHPFTAAEVAQVFIDNVYKLHGLPLNIITDRDPVFTSQF